MSIQRTSCLVFILIASLGCSLTKNKIKSHTVKDLSEIEANLDVKKKVFSNGLTLLVLENRHLPIFSYYTFYNIGGRHESREEQTTGTTHFLEHMMFKGAKEFGPGVFDSTIEASGGSTNAYTTFDNTVYYQNLPSEMLEKIIAMEADRMQNLLLEPESFEKERQVVFEERKYRYENSPSGKLYLKTMQEAFKGTPYGGSVIGEVEDLKALNREKMFEFFHKYYVPNNATIVVVGDVNATEVEKLIEKKFGHIPRSEALVELAREKDRPELYAVKRSFNTSIKLHGSSPIPMFTKSYRGEPLGTRKAYVMDLLASILGDGNSSFLVQRYVKSPKPILSKISMSNYNLKYNGIFFIGGELLAGVSPARFEKRLANDTKLFCQEPLNERNLQKVKNQFLVSYYRQIQSNGGLATFLGLRENFFGNYEIYKEELKIYESINLEELKQVCEEVFLGKEKGIFMTLWEKNPK